MSIKTNQHDVIPNQDNDEIDLLALLSVILNGWKIITAFALLGLLLGILYSRYVSPTYKTEALIQIDEESTGISALGRNISELVSSEASPAETERELIKSRMVLQPVVNKLHLDIRISNPTISAIDKLRQSAIPTQQNSINGVTLETEQGKVNIRRFEVPHDYLNKEFILTGINKNFIFTDDLKQFKGKIGTPTVFNTDTGDIVIDIQSLPDDNHPITITKLSDLEATGSINSSLSVTERGEKTGIIELTMTGNNQERITTILEEIVRFYVIQNQSRGSEQTTTTIKFLESQIPKLKQTLEQSETAFNKFREKYGTIDVSKESELLLTESYQIDAQLSKLKLQKAELTTYYTTEHPLVTQIDDQINVLINRKQEIENTITKQPEIQREFLQLSEDVGINREIYLTLLKNYEQLKIARAGEIGYVRIVDLPLSTFEPIAPKKAQIWVLSLLLGTMLGTALVLLKNLLRNAVKDPDHVEAKTGVPVIATIPRSDSLQRLGGNKNKAGRLLTIIERDGLSYEGIKSLRTSIMFDMPRISKNVDLSEYTDESVKDIKGKVILITGESPGIGKSFISANLAEVFSQLNKKILIIDGDMRLGELHNTFKIKRDSGLAEYLSHDSEPFEKYIRETDFNYIDFMPRGRQPHNPSSLLANGRFAELMLDLVRYYDYVIVDSPPVLAASDAIIMAQFADKVLMVTRYKQSIEGQLVYAIKQMHKANVMVDGIVINDMKQGMMDKYSYHYSYAYGQSNNKS